MANTYDVAKYILEKCGEMTAMKLQKLLYYSQAWHLVWNEEPLFNDDFQAWANGPVLPNLYQRHKGQFRVGPSLLGAANAAALSPLEVDAVDKVLGFYGDKTAQWLSNLTHQESPWLDARAGTEPGATSEAVITQSSMAEYYEAL